MYFGESMAGEELIIQKARELAAMIENHDVTVRYRESLDRMKNDPAAQKLLSELIRIGGEISSQGDTTQGGTGKGELELLKSEFEQNDTVKNHILAQREYLSLIQRVQEKIKNPDIL